MKTITRSAGVVVGIALLCFGVLRVSADTEKLTVAVLGFETKEKAVVDLGTKITNLVVARLSANPGIKLVERERLDKILEELGLGLSGIVSDGQAAQIGHLSGAKILVTGRAFTVDKDLIIVAKVIGTETSMVQAEIVTGSLSGKLAPVVEELARKIAKVITEKGPTMVAKVMTEQDRIKGISAKLKDMELPKVLVAIAERHLGRPAIDPAAETELIYILKKCGFTVATTKESGLSDWAKEYLEKAQLDIPAAIKADVIILGEAFSEFGTRTGNLVSSKARVEIQAIDRLTGKVLAIDRKTNVAVDISELIAANTAIQKAASDIATRLIPEFVKNWNAEKG